MGISGRQRFVTILALAATIAGVVAVSATAEQVVRERFHEEGTFVIEDFCDVSGMDVELAFSADVSVKAVPHGKSGLVYFLENVRETDVFTNPANGKFVTLVSKVINKDLRVTDNGDGTLTILVLATGNDVLYGPDGKAIGRNPGQIRFEILVDHGGTPTDPSDDQFLEFLGVVKDSTGRNDDFCESALPVLT